LGQGTRRLSEVADRFGRTSLPQLDRAADATTQAARGLGRLASGVSENPQGLLYGAPRISPGPGEPGFVVPPAGHSGEHP
ncbi:MAG: MCE family protein, partial [Comamonas sp.]